jgi:hypothetical protein
MGLFFVRREVVMQQWYQCPRCGAQVAFGTRFCGNCRTPLNWPTQQQPQPPQQQYQQQQYQQPYQQTPQYQQQPPQYQQPEPPKKKSKLGIILLGVILFALAAVGSCVVCVMQPGSSETPYAGTPPVTETSPAFNVSRSTLFDLLATPTDIEPTLVDGEQYAVSGWERSDLNDGTPRWMTQVGEIYLYELIGEPAYKLTLLAGVTGEFEDSADLIVRAVLLIRATGVPKDEAGDVFSELMNKSLADPDKSYEKIAGGNIVSAIFNEILPSMLISVEAFK